MGGSFHYIGSVTGQAALLSATTGTYDANFPKIDGIVYATIPDGNGGWFIGGDFTEIAGIARSRIAHILSDNSVDPNWNPGANNRVLSFALTPDKKTLFVAGGFTTIAGNSVSNIAAISAVNGQMVSNWAISADYEIISISLLGNILYVGGGFANIGGLKRDGLAAINISTLTVNAWDPNKGGINPSGTYLINNVTAINKKVFIGGRFTSMNGVACSGLISVDATTANVDESLIINFNASLTTISIDKNATVLYAGGDFDLVGTVACRGIAKIDLTTGKHLTNWKPSPNLGVSEITLSEDESTLYVSGSFVKIGGEWRNKIAALNAATGAVTNWAPHASDLSNTISVYGDKVLIGGSFTSVNGILRRYAAAVSVKNSVVLDWNPDMEYDVYAMARKGNKLYMGGWFVKAGTTTRNFVAAVDVTTAAVDPDFNPSANGIVWGLVTDNNNLFAYGTFTTIGGNKQKYVSKLDMTTGAPILTFNPDVDARVTALAIDGNTVYLGGFFGFMGSTVRNRIGAVDITTGAPTSWNPVANNLVKSLALSSDKQTIFACGLFTQIGGQTRRSFAALSTATGKATNLNVIVDLVGYNNSVDGFSISDNTLFAFGSFNDLNGKSRAGFASIDAASGDVTDWNPATYGKTFFQDGLLANSNFVLVGGGFSKIDGRLCSNFGIVKAGYPNAPILNEASNINTNTFTANWTAATTGNLATKYVLDLSLQSDNFAPAKLISASGALAQTAGIQIASNINTQSITGLELGKTYVYRIRAVNAFGSSAFSNTQTITPVASNTPSSISSFLPTAGPRGTLITISGVNLNSITNVAINGEYAESFVFNSGDIIAKVAKTTAYGSGSIILQSAQGNIYSPGLFTVSFPTAVQTEFESQPLHVSPIPFTTELRLQGVELDIGECKAILYNISGIPIANWAWVQTSITVDKVFDVPEVAPGFYILEILQNEKVKRFRVMK